MAILFERVDCFRLLDYFGRLLSADLPLRNHIPLLIFNQLRTPNFLVRWFIAFQVLFVAIIFNS